MRLFALLLLVLPMAVQAQTQDQPLRPAVLVADEIYIAADRELIARGNVEAFQGPVRLQAEEIRYDRVTGALTITGPIRLQDGSDIVMLANAAELDETLRTGLLMGARIVIDQQLQIAAPQVQRVNDRYNQIYKTAVTSCDTCEDGKPPLWQIRANGSSTTKRNVNFILIRRSFACSTCRCFTFHACACPTPRWNAQAAF